jgi:hypothetical protein
MIFPAIELGPPPNSDLSDAIQADYNEARSIAQQSPRGAASLLRLSVQKLCQQLGEKGKNIDDDIAALVKKGLPVQIQKALDAVRVIGNHAVHPGELDLKDDIATVETLFGVINLIADRMITQPKELNALYDTLPEGAKDRINRRDGRDVEG